MWAAYQELIVSGEPKSSPGEPEDAVTLLVQAVNQLPAGDRDQVFAWLLRAGGRPYRLPGATGLLEPRTATAGIWRIFQEAKSASAQQPGAPQQMVPVRFPADQHAKLREWCAEHGFSMATVIRGLVAKFLDDQLPQHN
jgi:hypothetical protein